MAGRSAESPYWHNWEFCSGIIDLQKHRKSHHIEHYKSDWGMYHLGKIAMGPTHLSVSSFSEIINQMQTSLLSLSNMLVPVLKYIIIFIHEGIEIWSM